MIVCQERLQGTSHFVGNDDIVTLDSILYLGIKSIEIKAKYVTLYLFYQK